MQDQLALLTAQANMAKTVKLNAARDSALRELLANDNDRATFAANAARNAPGGRGRSGNPLPDWTSRRGGGGGGRGALMADTAIWNRVGAGMGGSRVGGAGGGARGGRGGGGGGGGGRGAAEQGTASQVADTVRLFVSSIFANMTFQHLFEGITLTTDQEAKARELIRNTQLESRPPALPFVSVLRLNRATGNVVMQAESAAELSALLSNESDRATLQSRILIVAR